jgi:undecaprenyl-diphosphatase
MEWWQAVVLGLVEGITEYLPVSSTGHLILTSSLLGLDTPERREALAAFEVVIQGGAILAVLGLYAGRVASLFRGAMGRDPDGLRLLVNLVVAFLPVVVLGPLLDKAIEAHLFHPVPVLAALALGGVWMIALGRSHERYTREGRDVDHLGWRQAAAIGLLQCGAMWPGTSRSMMTIAGGLLLGLAPRAAAEFSFLLGLPTLGAACVFKLAKNVIASSHAGTPNFVEQLGVGATLLGVAVATISAALAVRWLVSFLSRHGLAAFGWYRLALCGVLGALLFTGMVELRP